MDKYEYNLKLEEITKLADQGYYEDAADIIDTIDWRRVRNVRTLCMISEIYEELICSKSRTLVQVGFHIRRIEEFRHVASRADCRIESAEQ